MSNFSSFKGNKLISSSNYIEWKTNTDLFLEINSYMSYINRTETTPNRQLYYKINTSIGKDGKETKQYGNALLPELGTRYTDKLSDFNRNNKRALRALKSIILIDNNNRFKDKLNTEELYKAITTIFS